MEGTPGCKISKNILLLSMMDVIRQIAATFRGVMASHDPKITVDELAEMTGLSRQTIGATISGKQPKVSFITIKKISDVLGLSLDVISRNENQILATAERPAIYAESNTGPKKKSLSVGVGKQVERAEQAMVGFKKEIGKISDQAKKRPRKAG